MGGSNAIRRLTEVVKYLRDEVNPDLALSMLLGFLLVCQKEGITQTELGERLGLTSGAISRMCKILGKFQVKEEREDGTVEKVTKGLGLILLSPDIYERRRMAAWLTSRGKEVRDELEKLIHCS